MFLSVEHTNRIIIYVYEFGVKITLIIVLKRESRLDLKAHRCREEVVDHLAHWVCRWRRRSQSGSPLCRNTRRRRPWWLCWASDRRRPSSTLTYRWGWTGLCRQPWTRTPWYPVFLPPDTSDTLRLLLSPPSVPETRRSTAALQWQKQTNIRKLTNWHLLDKAGTAQHWIFRASDIILSYHHVTNSSKSLSNVYLQLYLSVLV